MYPLLLMVISIPSANWAQFSAEGTAVLEIDLLKVQQASQPAASASKPITQLVAQPLYKKWNLIYLTCPRPNRSSCVRSLNGKRKSFLHSARLHHARKTVRYLTLPAAVCATGNYCGCILDFDEIKEYEFSAAGYQRNEEEYLHLHDIMSSDVYREISRCLGVWTFYIYMEFGFS
ncbi:hypothetical protein F2P81_004868 [Scophthalmus maximus]|uniref:Uncharacterized protein n=1 Tax=Scophthalmus maximus TaxID=52904 RepID=A0A6A4TL06_SCOMX|nr:hypothetical protein F2P81_004868 [Scophthalmus maximus]